MEGCEPTLFPSCLLALSGLDRVRPSARGCWRCMLYSRRCATIQVFPVYCIFTGMTLHAHISDLRCGHDLDAEAWANDARPHLRYLRTSLRLLNARPRAHLRRYAGARARELPTTRRRPWNCFPSGSFCHRKPQHTPDLLLPSSSQPCVSLACAFLLAIISWLARCGQSQDGDDGGGSGVHDDIEMPHGNLDAKPARLVELWQRNADLGGELGPPIVPRCVGSKMTRELRGAEPHIPAPNHAARRMRARLDKRRGIEGLRQTQSTILHTNTTQSVPLISAHPP